MATWVTLTLIQGVSIPSSSSSSRIVGYVVDSFLRRNDEESSSAPRHRLHGHQHDLRESSSASCASIIVAWFSRQREFRADAGAAGLMGSALPMQNARVAWVICTEPLPQNMAASGIAGGQRGLMALFATHPPLEERIAALDMR